jgi:hypothetical protein
MNYKIRLTALQNQTVRNALFLYMDVNLGKLEAVLDMPFVKRRLGAATDRLKYARFAIDGIIKNTLIDSSSRENYRDRLASDVTDFPFSFLSKDEGWFCFTEGQANIIVSVLDFYFRIGIGQMENLLEQPFIWQHIPLHETRYVLEDAVYMLKTFIDMPRNGSHSIYNSECPEAQQAYDILSVIRHRLAWDKAGNPPTRDWKTMFGPHYVPPSHIFKDWPLAKIMEAP